jgi:hypothetical protein
MYTKSSSCITEIKSPSAGPTTVAPTAPQNAYQPGFALPQIPIRMINAPDIDLSNIESSKVKDIVRSIAEEAMNILNVDITKVDIADLMYSERKLTLNDNLARSNGYNQRYLESVLTLLIEIRVSETSILPQELYLTIMGSLQLRKYEIDQVLREALGSQYNDVVLEIDGHRTTVSPSASPGATSDIKSVTERGTGAADVGELKTAHNSSTMTVVMVVLFSLFFAAVTFGLIIWQRKRERITDKAFVTRSNQYHHRKRSPRKKHRRKSSKKKPNVSETTLKIANYPYVDEEQGKVDEKLMLDYTPQETQPVTNEVQHVTNEEVLELGYDGGQSSFLGSQGNLSNSSFNAASRHRDGIDLEEEGSVGDNVLGLLYYAGASSGDEQDDPAESKKKARMQRRASNASSRQTRTSARSRRSSTSGKSKLSLSLKSKSSRNFRRSMREPNPLHSVEEEENVSFHREEHFNQFGDEPSLGEEYPGRIPTLRPNSGCSVSVSTVSDDEGYMKFSRRKTVDTTFTEDATSLNVDDLFT